MVGFTGLFIPLSIAFEPLAIAAMVIMGLTLSVAVYQWSFLRIRAQLRLFLKEHYLGRKLPLCLGCGYNLEGVDAQRCPECGASIIVPDRGPRGA